MAAAQNTSKASSIHEQFDERELLQGGSSFALRVIEERKFEPVSSVRHDFCLSVFSFFESYDVLTIPGRFRRNLRMSERAGNPAAEYF